MEMEKKVVFLDDMSKIIDEDFIFINVGWSNHGDPLTSFQNKDVNFWLYFDDETNEVKQFIFDEVQCFGIHGFGGTSYDFRFYLNGEFVEIGLPNNKFAPSLEKLKELKVQEINKEIEWVDRLSEKKTSLLDKLKLIQTL